MREAVPGESEARSPARPEDDSDGAGGGDAEGGELPAQLGRYQIVGRLAQGGMAEVLLARATGPGGFQRELVIKRLARRLAGDQAVLHMFLDEARLSASLRHPNIVQVLEVEHDERGAFMAMELLHGRDLRAVARRLAARRRRWPLALALHVVQCACLGLHHAHEHTDERGRPLGVVHRDVSPHNLHVTYQGEVKVLDFGIARAEGRLDATRTGIIKGKLGYMSPEQCRGKPLDRRSDVFCLGILLCELTTSQKLYRGRDDYELLRAIVEEPPRRPSADVPDYPPALEAIALAALEHEPARRTPTALALFEQLEAFRKARGLDAGPRELGGFLRELFAGELASWKAARGEPARQLEALRAGSASESESESGSESESESESGSESGSGSGSGSGSESASESVLRSRQPSQRATVTLTQPPPLAALPLPPTRSRPRRLALAAALLVASSALAASRLSRAPDAPAVAPASHPVPGAAEPAAAPPVQPHRADRALAPLTTPSAPAPAPTPAAPAPAPAAAPIAGKRATSPRSATRARGSTRSPSPPVAASSAAPDAPALAHPAPATAAAGPAAPPPSSTSSPPPAATAAPPPSPLPSPPSPATKPCKDDDCVL